MSRRIDPPVLAEEVLAGSRAALARAITLVESTRADHRALAGDLLTRLLPHAGGATRVGITGVPGSGKSTFIEALGVLLTDADRRVAVLAVDPSSSRTGGSILGDKTRMARLATDPRAFVRPSPTSGTLGGVARATQDAIVLVEAAGYDVVIVETVGVGQSETAVANMVDTFLLLALARTGDQLQGIKKGVLELADLVAVNKADGSGESDARVAARELTAAMRLIHPPRPGQRNPPVLTCSGLTGAGVDQVWRAVTRHRERLAEDDGLAAKRADQRVDWIWSMVRDRLLTRLTEAPAVREVAPEVERRVREGALTATLAADRILEAFTGGEDTARDR